MTLIFGLNLKYGLKTIVIWEYGHFKKAVTYVVLICNVLETERREQWLIKNQYLRDHINKVEY